ncbi:lysophospholipid acyltransferase family protein [Gilvimarinus algae]|uniref:L-ornithine N(alpha)-acyltransferase n=1 Tax=Gilvimarinus algae TaxID=3058037 RepID=A0ABT8TL10_9GAMM|nr:lysophospholipid acyltransferase family protein [Gilvimarinus sp. SDUM040014]MDO3383321.1 lysophospholipid acyltransferase family protein [Gilvimarinus sp. SDUM040014]
MLNIEQSVTEKFPRFANTKPIIRRPTLSLLRKLTHEQEINQFLRNHEGLRGIDFIDQIFEFFNFTYSVGSRDRNNIPAQGRVVIIANHPIGSLDGLALLRMVSEVRPDVRIVANDMLMAFEPLHNVFLPLDNMTRGAYRRSYKAIAQALNNDQAVIIFPAGEVSRASPKGIRDGAWHAGFLHFARKTGSPILPMFIEAKNSLLFYSASMLYKPFGTALLAREMFKKQSAEIRIRIGEPIPHAELDTDKLADKALIKRLKKHVYKLRKKRGAQFVTERTIAHPEERGAIKAELANAQHIGTTSDNNKIFLCDYQSHPTVLREIGRLREHTFRLVGEGTGARRDLDKYDHHYRHLVLWDESNLTIAGAYRIGDCGRILQQMGAAGLYTDELFNYHPEVFTYLEQGVELGRSFVNPKYWGKASLDYLWQGLGAYLTHNPQVRYVLGPVSMSAAYPKALRDLTVYFYERYYRTAKPLAQANHPHFIEPDDFAAINQRFSGMDQEQAFRYLQQQFAEAGHKFPTLYKQYAALYEPGGYSLLAFSVDSDFGDCLDGLFMGDLTLMKATKKKRYFGEDIPPVAVNG